MKALRIATCQFAVEADIAHNRRWILKQIDHAADQGRDAAMNGQLHSGDLVDDPRSANATCL